MHKFIFIIALLLPTLAFSQEKGTMASIHSRLFELVSGADTIEFIQTGEQLTAPKPVLLFFQGSLPRPLVLDFENGALQLVNFNFDYTKLIGRYHLVTIAMPFTPAVCKLSATNNNACYVPDPKGAPDAFEPRYLRANYLDTYVARGQAVVDFLLRQDWVDKQQILALGHSQGSKVALKVALSRPQISRLGFFSGNPLGRFDQFVREYRLAENKGEMSSAAAQAGIDQLYRDWEELYKNPLDNSEPSGDTNRATTSFSENFVDDLLALNIPVYVAYGTRDTGSQPCDLLPLEFIRQGKRNLTLKPYPGWGHNFEETDDTGRSDFNRMHWQEVVEAFLEWSGKP